MFKCLESIVSQSVELGTGGDTEEEHGSLRCVYVS